MAHDLLQQHPFPFDREDAQALLDVLVQHYSTQPSTMALVEKAAPELVSSVNWAQPMYLVWHEIARESANAVVWDALIEAVLADPRAKRSIGPRIEELLAQEAPPMAAKPPRVGMNWAEWEPGAYERLLGEESTLLDIAFLQRALEVGAAVARLVVPLAKGKGLGTGFRVGKELVLTNHHVAYDGGQASKNVAVEFRYEVAFGSSRVDPLELRGDTIDGNADPRRDWALIRVRPDTPIPDDIPILKLGTATVREHERVYIIQHPNGEPKKIGMHHNLVTFVDDDLVQYLTDTMAGSSGSPVFNSEWEVVALHHKWVREDVAAILAEGQRTEFRNQGVRIDRVRQELLDRRHLPQ